MKLLYAVLSILTLGLACELYAETKLSNRTNKKYELLVGVDDKTVKFEVPAARPGTSESIALPDNIKSIEISRSETIYHTEGKHPHTH